MKKSIYLDNGYLNFEAIEENNYMYTWIVGGKGMGKTFNTLAYLLTHDIPFVFIRRLESETKKASNKQVGDIAKVMDYLGIKENYTWGKIDDLIAIYKDEKLMILCGALKTLGKLTGVNLEPFDYLIFDEFIPKPMEPKLKGESEALPLLFDTIMRNKEIDGRKPAKFVGLANSYNINNPQFMCYNLVNEAEALTNSNKDYITRGAHIIYMPKNSPILKQKAEAESVKNSSKDFTDMSISNKFIMNDFSYVKKEKLSEYQCVCSIGYLYIYAHKSNSKLYACKVKGRTQRDREYPQTITGIERFRRQEWRLWGLYLDGYIRFDSYDSISKFEYYFGK